MHQASSFYRQDSLFPFDELAPSEHKLMRLCPVREVFPREADFETWLLHNSDCHALIGEQAGLDVTQVARQVRTTRDLGMRMDLLMRGDSPVDPLIVVELLLDRLDTEHVLRGLGYACSSNARHLVFVATSFPPAAHNLLAEWAWATKHKNLTIHLISVKTGFLPDGSAACVLMPVTPPAAVDHRQAFLEALIPLTTKLGDDSLVNCNVTDGRRLESYVGLNNILSIRIYAGHGNARISVLARDKSIAQRLAQAQLLKKLAKTLAEHSPQLISGGEGGAVAASFAWAFDTSTTTGAESAIQRIATAYVTVRKKLLAILDDLGLPPTPQRPTVRFLRGHGLSPEVKNALSAVNRDVGQA